MNFMNKKYSTHMCDKYIKMFYKSLPRSDPARVLCQEVETPVLP